VRHPCTHVTAFLDPVHYECLSKAGALLLDHLVHRRLWSYTRLPIDGLSSVVFHGNSPTLCMGSGNVWVDHYDPAQQRCITPKDALTLDVHPYWRHIFNMPHFFTQGQLVGSCLRVRRVSYCFCLFCRGVVQLQSHLWTVLVRLMVLRRVRAACEL
jgi:hypothetical protein